MINVYAPTLPSSDEEKAKFYYELNQVLSKILAADKIIFLGDFNARVDADYDAWNGVIRRHGIGKCNVNGFDLLALCAEFYFTITNTCFRLPGKFKTTWMHPRSKHWHLLDYVIVQRRDLKDVLISRVIRGAQGCTDHQLVRTKLRLNVQLPRRASHNISSKVRSEKFINNKGLSKKLDHAFCTALPEITENTFIEETWRLYATNLRSLQVLD